MSLIAVGDNSCGKTTFLKTLQQTKEVSTQWTINDHMTCNVRELDASLHSSLASNVLLPSNYCVFLVMFDVNKNFSQAITDWLELIEASAPFSGKIVLVATKCEWINYDEKMKGYPSIIDQFLASLKKSQEKLISAIVLSNSVKFLFKTWPKGNYQEISIRYIAEYIGQLGSSTNVPPLYLESVEHCARIRQLHQNSIFVPKDTFLQELKVACNTKNVDGCLEFLHYIGEIVVSKPREQVLYQRNTVCLDPPLLLELFRQLKTVNVDSLTGITKYSVTFNYSVLFFGPIILALGRSKD